MRNNVRYENLDEVILALKNISLRFQFNEHSGKSEIYLNEEHVEQYIRDMIVAEKVSEVAAIKDVRQFAVAQQQEMGKEKGIVMDGRDIGSVVFPMRNLKFS